MIKRIEVKKLFGKFDYIFEFVRDNIMIITGPNGYGKTTILKMIDSFSNNRMEEFVKYRFEKFSIECNDYQIELKKTEDGIYVDGLFIQYPDEKSLVEENHLYRILRRKFRNDVEYLGVLLDEENIENLSSEDPFLYKVLLDYKRRLVTNDKKAKKEFNNLMSIIEKIEKAKKEIGKVSFIREQRLIEIKEYSSEDAEHSERKEDIHVIEQQSEKLKKDISDIMRKHSALSSELDSSYIERLFDKKESQKQDIERIEKELKELQIKQEKLNKYGLAVINNVSNIDTLEEGKINRFYTELSIYIEDANEKYNIFEPIINKLDLYEKIVNQKLMFKKMELSGEKGVVVKSDNNEVLSLTSLSSGEQEILVLFYKLIFEADVNLLLIDEPEISLHIAWQKDLMKNLRNIVSLNDKIQIIIATHSPQIVAGNLDLQVDLGGQYNE